MRPSVQFDRQIDLIAKGPAVLFRHPALDSGCGPRWPRSPLRQAAEVEAAAREEVGLALAGVPGVVEELAVGWCRAAALSDDA